MIAASASQLLLPSEKWIVRAGHFMKGFTERYSSLRCSACVTGTTVTALSAPSRYIQSRIRAALLLLPRS